jgi:uncharacterized protein (TIGR03790 family)
MDAMEHSTSLSKPSHGCALKAGLGVRAAAQVVATGSPSRGRRVLGGVPYARPVDWQCVPSGRTMSLGCTRAAKYRRVGIRRGQAQGLPAAKMTCRIWMHELLLVALALPAFAVPLPLNQRVLVIYNGFSKHSKEIAQYYMQARHIPAGNKCELKPVEFKAGISFPIVYVAYEDLDNTIRNPIRKCLGRVGKEKILYLVLTFDVPYRLRATPEGAGVSLDSYLSDIWNDVSDHSPEANPYYALVANKANIYVPFVSLAEYREKPGSKLVYSVWRLDAATPALAKGLVDKAIAAEDKGFSGIACFDRRTGGEDMKIEDRGYPAADWDLHRAAQFAHEVGFEVVEDSHEEEFGTPPAPARCDHAALYSGWYSLDHYNDAFSWSTGAIGFHLDSASAASPRSGTNWSANAIYRGITVTSGAIAEPYLTGLPHPAGVFRNLFEGANVGDAFLRNTMLLKWQILNLGDPLYTPFPGGRGPFRRGSEGRAHQTQTPSR